MQTHRQDGMVVIWGRDPGLLNLFMIESRETQDFLVNNHPSSSICSIWNYRGKPWCHFELNCALLC